MYLLDAEGSSRIAMEKQKLCTTCNFDKGPSRNDVSSKGEGGGQKYWNLLGKNTKKGEGGGHKIGKMGRRCLWMPPKQDVIYFTKFSKPTMCRVSEAVIKKGIDPLLLGQNHKEDCL